MAPERLYIPDAPRYQDDTLPAEYSRVTVVPFREWASCVKSSCGRYQACAWFAAAAAALGLVWRDSLSRLGVLAGIFGPARLLS
jgi:hypothetical protein